MACLPNKGGRGRWRGSKAGEGGGVIVGCWCLSVSVQVAMEDLPPSRGGASM